jgi:hypothetical protein
MILEPSQDAAAAATAAAEDTENPYIGIVSRLRNRTFTI